MPTVILPVTCANYVINKRPSYVFRDKATFSIGVNQKNTVYRVLLYADLDILSNDIDIDSASLKMYAAEDRSTRNDTNTLITPYVITSPWNESEVTWDNQPEINVQIAGSTAEVRTEGWVNFNITNIVKAWINGTFSNHGLLLKSSGDILSDLKKFFSLKTHNYEQYLPVLELKYKFKNPVCISSRNAVSLFEQYRTEDIFLYSKWIDIANYTKCTFFVQIHNSIYNEYYVNKEKLKWS